MTQDSKPQLTPASTDLAELFHSAIKSLPEAQVRKTFGYPASYVNGHMFAGLFQDYMFVRLSAENLATFLGIEGARPFAPIAGRPMQGYAVVPGSILHNDKELTAWLGKAFTNAQSLPPKQPKPRAKKTKKV